MKYIYILGSEHSGTTLVSNLIAQAKSTVAMGEVSRFLSPRMLQGYQNQWGTEGAAIECSCGKTWQECEFWSGIESVWGLTDDIPKLERYRRYFEHVRCLYGDGVNVVDSSKTLDDLRYIVSNADQFSLGVDDIYVLLVVKDPRSFAISIKRKNSGNLSFLNTLRTYNWWLSANRENLSYLRSVPIDWECIHYEKLCLDGGVLKKKLQILGAGVEQVTNGNESHIVLSNKKFLAGDRQTIRYDYSWFSDLKIQRSYLLHSRAAALNNELFEL